MSKKFYRMNSGGRCGQVCVSSGEYENMWPMATWIGIFLDGSQVHFFVPIY